MTGSMFLNHFVISTVVSSLTVAIIMLIKKVFQKHLSAKWQYNLWFLLLIALTLPFIPNHFFGLENHFTFHLSQSNGLSTSTIGNGDYAVENGNWLRDFSISIDRSTPLFLNKILEGSWIAGMLVWSVLAVRAWLKIKYIKSTTSVLKNKEVLILFEQCKQDLNITKPLILLESPFIKSPMTFGFFRTYVVLPLHFDGWLSMRAIKYIFLHELNHYKNKDIVTNYLIVIYQILYWFNPLVWIAFKEMRLDREIACDIAVLKSVDVKCYGEYGSTIIDFVDRESRTGSFPLASQLSGSRKQIKRRIETIASFTAESKLSGLKSIAIFMLVGVFVASQVPLISVMAADNNYYDFKSDRVEYADLNEYFAEFEGSFVLYDMQADQYSIYNENKSKRRVSPNSTYKIFISLFALDSNAITSEDSKINWNGMQYPFDAWNRDQNLYTAMKNSVNWYFQELDKRTSADKLQAYLKKIGYGNYDLSSGLAQYWIESSLKISPVEQVQLLKAFYTNQFGFKEKDVQTVKDMIKLEEKDGRTLFGKTGTGTVNNKDINGWFIGYVESRGDTYFFATNIQDKDKSNGSTAAEITLSILRDKEIY